MARAYRDFTSLLLALGMVFVSTLGISKGTDWTKLNEEYEKKIQPLIEKYCSGCHTGADAESGLAFNNFADAKSVFRQRRIWEKVAVRIDIGDMPPADSPQPSPEDRKTLTSWIQSTLNDIDCG
ncbi:MAG: c-type cytochrome domain-containing protein, partial [Pirellula sp.]